MFSDLWPDVPAEEVPIASVTNGVHAHTWVAPEMADLLTRYVLPEWHEAEAERWERLAEARDDEVWRAREQGREAHGRPSCASGSATSSWRGACPPATSSGPTRCSTRRRSPSASPAGSPPTSGPRSCCPSPTGSSALLLSGDRPVQMVFAGKSHPADDSGKELIRQVERLRRRSRRAPPLRVRRRLRHRRRPLARSRAPTCGSTTPGARRRPAARRA